MKTAAKLSASGVQIRLQSHVKAVTINRSLFSRRLLVKYFLVCLSTVTSHQDGVLFSNEKSYKDVTSKTCLSFFETYMPS